VHPESDLVALNAWILGSKSTLLKFIVMSDIHLVPEGQVTYGIDTFARTKAAVEFINERHSDAAFVVFAGDLTEHGEALAYERFFELAAQLTPDVYPTLGNHDDHAAFSASASASAQPEALRRIDHAIDAEGYRVIVLDTLDPETGHSGRVSDDQLGWLAERLGEERARPVIIVLHHNLVALDVQMDAMKLANTEALLDVLEAHPDVRMIVTGHVHMTTAGQVRGIPFTSLSGAHYSIEPVLKSFSGDDFAKVPRREGPGQIAVVLARKDNVVVHFENFFDSHRRLTIEGMGWDGS